MKNRFSLPAVLAVVVSMVAAAGVLYFLSIVQEQVEESVRRNFVAAGNLARVQVHAERMRRYEKEMFIYVNNQKKRAEYAAAFDTSARDLLTDLDLALLPTGRSFTDEQRKAILQWKEAANFYINEFDRLVRHASRLDEPASAAAAEMKTTLDFNAAIGPGKDRFRVLIKGADEMRQAKEKSSMQIAGEIDREFSLLFSIALGLTALGVVLALLWPMIESMIGAFFTGRRRSDIAAPALR
jgi:hypothetical protein